MSLPPPQDNAPTSGPLPEREGTDQDSSASARALARAAAMARNVAPLPVSPMEQPGDRIGPYHLLSVLGEGGFGVVYLAERREPIVQRVALKIIKPGMDSRQVIARFEQERQALAVLDHPAIAKVFDAGAAPSGRPYFVMEYVRGEALTEFCDRQKYTIAQRLALFTRVCDAVQHAHNKGIIHRDLKPSNILVSQTEGDAEAQSGAVVKVIDFGIAKAMRGPLTERTVFTEMGMLIGTPEYMSPEQAEMGRLDIDTRTDVYSLGVILYQLLTGLLPFDPRSLRSAGFMEIQRIIREVEPPRPSTRLSDLASLAKSSGARSGRGSSAAPPLPPKPLPGPAEGLGASMVETSPSHPPSPTPALSVEDEAGLAGLTLETISRQRRAAIEVLRRELQRELEWIPLKAMRKDRAERYSTPSALAEDVRNYLAGKPLVAAPESAVYQIRKLVRRHKGPFLAAAAVLAASMLFGSLAAWQAARATRNQRLAESREQDALSSARVANAALDFQDGVISSVAPGSSDGGLDVPMQTAFRVASERALRLSEGEPRVAARINLSVGRTHASLGDLVRAEEHLIRARALYDTLAARPSGLLPEELTLKEETELSLAEVWLRQEKPREAEAAVRPVVSARSGRLGAESPPALAARNQLANALKYQGAVRWPEALAMYNEVLDARRRTIGPDDPSTLQSVYNLGLMRVRMGDTAPDTGTKVAEYDMADPLLRSAFEGRVRALGPDDPATLESAAEAGSLFFRRALAKGNDADLMAQAEAAYSDCAPRQERVLGQGHWRTLETKVNLAWVRYQRGRAEEAVPMMREVVVGYRAMRGPSGRDTITVRNRLAKLLELTGDTAGAEIELIEAYDALVAEPSIGAGHERAREQAAQVAELFKRLGRSGEVEEWERKAGDPP